MNRPGFVLMIFATLSLNLGSVVRAADDVNPDDMIIGNPKAQCTVIEYAALHCPFCARFHETILPRFKAEYLDTGKAKLVFRDFPINQPDVWAAQVSICAGPMLRPGYVKQFFQTQNEWSGKGDATLDNMAKVARIAGMSRERFDDCLRDKAIEEKILQTEFEATKRYNVSGTPTFVVDGKAHNDISTYEQLLALLRVACGI